MILMPCFVFFVFIFCNRLLTQASHTVIIKHTQAAHTLFDASATAESCKIFPDQSATAEMVNWTPPDVSVIKRKIWTIRSECGRRRLNGRPKGYYMNELGAVSEDECGKAVGLAWAVPNKFKWLDS